MIELSPYHLWPVVIFGAIDQEHLKESQGVKCVLVNDTLYDCAMLAGGAYRQYEGARVFTDHRKGGAADFDRLGSPLHVQVGWIVAPYWDAEFNQVRGYLHATGIQSTLAHLEAAGRLAEQKLSHSVDILCQRFRAADGFTIDLVTQLNRVKSVDLIPMGARPASSGRLLERRYFPELVAIAQGRTATAAAIRRALRIAEAMRQAREILARPDPQPAGVTLPVSIDGLRRRETWYTPFIDIRPVG